MSMQDVLLLLLCLSLSLLLLHEKESRLLLRGLLLLLLRLLLLHGRLLHRPLLLHRPGIGGGTGHRRRLRAVAEMQSGLSDLRQSEAGAERRGREAMGGVRLGWRELQLRACSGFRALLFLAALAPSLSSALLSATAAVLTAGPAAVAAAIRSAQHRPALSTRQHDELVLLLAKPVCIRGARDAQIALQLIEYASSHRAVTAADSALQSG